MEAEFFELAEDLTDTDVPRMLFDVRHSEQGNRFFDADAFLSTNLDEPLPRLVLTELSKGRLCDFNLPAIATAILSLRLADFLAPRCRSDARLGDVQSEMGEWKSLHITTSLNCIDHVRSRLQYRPPHDPDAFRIYGVIRLAVDARRIPDSVNIFRLNEWSPCLLIRATIAEDLLSLGFSGFKVRPIPSYRDSSCDRSKYSSDESSAKPAHGSIPICSLCWDPLLSVDEIIRIPRWFFDSNAPSQFGTLHRACFEHWKAKCQASDG